MVGCVEVSTNKNNAIPNPKNKKKTGGPKEVAVKIPKKALGRFCLVKNREKMRKHVMLAKWAGIQAKGDKVSSLR